MSIIISWWDFAILKVSFSRSNMQSQLEINDGLSIYLNPTLLDLTNGSKMIKANLL